MERVSLICWLLLPQPVLAGVSYALGGNQKILVASLGGGIEPENTEWSLAVVASQYPTFEDLGTFEFTFVSTGMIGIFGEEIEGYSSSGEIILSEIPFGEHTIIFSPLYLEHSLFGTVNYKASPLSGEVQNDVRIFSGGEMDLEGSSVLFEMLPSGRFQFTAHLVGTIQPEWFVIIPEPSFFLLVGFGMVFGRSWRSV